MNSGRQQTLQCQICRSERNPFQQNKLCVHMIDASGKLLVKQPACPYGSMCSCQEQHHQMIYQHPMKDR